MKIALVGNTIFHQGAEFALVALARGLVAKGHQVDIILSKIQDDLVQSHLDWKPFELPDQARVLVQSYRRGRSSIPVLRRLMRENGYHVVMSHASPYSIPLALAGVGLRHRPILIHVHHTSAGVGLDAKGDLARPRFTIRSFIENHLMRLFDAQCGVSTGTSDAIHRVTGFPRERIFTVYNPVIDETFYANLKQAPSHPWLKTPTVPVIVAAGVLVPNKNYDYLIKAFAKVRQKRPARLVIFGKGPCLEAYQRLARQLGIQDDVSLPGFCDNLPAELKQATCFVVCSKAESFSVVCVQAMASGTPVVSSNCHYGPPEILRNGEYGILVEKSNVPALAEGIERVLDGQGIQPRPEMVAPYTVESVVGLYEKAMNDPRVRGKRKWMGC